MVFENSSQFGSYRRQKLSFSQFRGDWFSPCRFKWPWLVANHAQAMGPSGSRMLVWVPPPWPGDSLKAMLPSQHLYTLSHALSSFPALVPKRMMRQHRCRALPASHATTAPPFLFRSCLRLHHPLLYCLKTKSLHQSYPGKGLLIVLHRERHGRELKFTMAMSSLATSATSWRCTMFTIVGRS
jgi:hypothetical protein